MTEELEPAWYVMRSATKREATVAALCEKFVDCEVFCPRLKYKKATKRGVIWWVEPMFPGYFFAKFDYSTQHRHIGSQPGVTGIVKFAQNAPAVPDEIISSLRQSLAENEEDMLVLQPTLEPGDEIEVASGPLVGEKGIVSAVRPAAERVAVLLEFLGETNEIELDLYAIVTGRPTPTTT